jgi:metal-responsive CopG/Arc/MetJ family transcriptional regulator
MAKEKITISMEKKYVEELIRAALQRHISRSRIIEDAFNLWKKEQMEAALREGYQIMAKSDKKTAESNIKLAREMLHD